MRPKNKNDKVVDDTSNEETMKSTCQQVKKEDKEIPHSYKMLIVLRIEIALHKKSKPSSRITSSQAKHVKRLVSPTFSVDPSFPTESKAGFTS